jgi:hypothetical protein
VRGALPERLVVPKFIFADAILKDNYFQTVSEVFLGIVTA